MSSGPLGARAALVLALAGCAPPSPGPPVDTPAEVVGPEHSRVVASVEAVLTAINEGDVELLLQSMMADARIVAVRPGQPPAPSTVDDMATLLADPPRRFTERMWDPVVRIDGPIASVWAPYDFYLDDEFSHCGVDTFQMVKVEGEWRVQSLVYNTLQPPDCAPHPDGPPTV